MRFVLLDAGGRERFKNNSRGSVIGLWKHRDKIHNMKKHKVVKTVTDTTTETPDLVTDIILYFRRAMECISLVIRGEHKVVWLPHRYGTVCPIRLYVEFTGRHGKL